MPLVALLNIGRRRKGRNSLIFHLARSSQGRKKARVCCHMHTYTRRLVLCRCWANLLLPTSRTNRTTIIHFHRCFLSVRPSLSLVLPTRANCWTRMLVFFVLFHCPRRHFQSGRRFIEIDVTNKSVSMTHTLRRMGTAIGGVS